MEMNEKRKYLGPHQMTWLHNLKESPQWQELLSWQEKVTIGSVLNKGWYNNRAELKKLEYVRGKYVKYCTYDKKKFEVSLVDWK